MVNRVSAALARLLRPARARRLRLLLLPAVATLSIACSSGGGDPAEAVREYLQAKVTSDAAAIGRLLCSALESTLDQEVNTFRSVSDVKLEGVSCQRVGDSDRVKCDGKITAQYGAEQTEFPLETYRVVEEDGAWKWCGEAE